MARRATWSQYRETIGDRSGLFQGLAARWPVARALYLGSYVDLSPSTAIASVTYVDTDARAARFFADSGQVHTELAGRRGAGAGTDVRFLASDYTQSLEIPDASMDLLISLYTGPVWEHARRYLKPNGWLLANTSHGEASLAALDDALRLVAVVEHREGRYRLVVDGLGGYLVPKRPESASADRIRVSGRGIAYTRTAFAYLFQSR
jgi:SAM-dependent methyltransferase